MHEPSDIPAGDAGIIQLALERYKGAIEATDTLRTHMKEDGDFYAGDQWDDEAKQQRKGRPMLVINKLPGACRQITNEERQNRPAIKINPVDDHSDPKTAEVLQGIIRHIEVQSGYHPYDTAFESCTRIGIGWWRILTEYVDDNSFNQEIILKRILNHASVAVDPNAIEPDYSDMKYAFISEEMTIEEYMRLYPDEDLEGIQNFQHLGEELQTQTWSKEGMVRLAEYYYIEETEKTLVLVVGENGQQENVFDDELPTKLGEQGFTEWKDKDGKRKERKVQVKNVKWCKLNGSKILDRTDWPIKYIPLVPVLGDELWLDGKRDLRGLVRDAKDPIRMGNYWASKEAEVIAQTSFTPWVGTAEQFKNHEAKWDNANNRPQARGIYNPQIYKGQLVPMPARSSFEPPIQAISHARAQSSQDFEDVTSLHGPSMGRRQRADSGKAIEKLQQEGDTANYHFIDNLSRAIRHTGRILVALIPKIYDVEQVRRIIGDDEQERRVQVINDPSQKAYQEKEKPGGGIEKIYNIGTGKYDVVVSTGASFHTKRQEAVTSMMELVGHYPAMAEVGGDLLVKMMDFPLAAELAERLKKTLPEGIAEDEEEGDKKQLPPEVQKQLQEMDQMIKALSESLEEANEELDKKLPEIESRERIEQAKIELKRFELDLMQTLKMRELDLKAKVAHEELSTKEEIADEGNITKLIISKDSKQQKETAKKE